MIAPQLFLHLKPGNQVRQIRVIKENLGLVLSTSVFRAFQFRLMMKTDLRDGTTAGRPSAVTIRRRAARQHPQTARGRAAAAIQRAC
jgi:hypothetical protein